MRRCWLKGESGDALHAVLCAVGFNIRWLLRAIARGGIFAFLFLPRVAAMASAIDGALQRRGVLSVALLGLKRYLPSANYEFWRSDYKAELIHRRAPWKSRESVELATLQWVHWFNHIRLLEPIGYIPPAKAEAMK